LGAHALPPEYKDRPDAYVDFVVNDMLPAVAEWHHGSTFASQGILCFNDVFCEQNAFDVAQSRRVLEAGLALGLPVKIHADEFTALGGVTLALELGAVSADHLDVTTPEERAKLAESQTVGVVLPAVNFNLGSSHFADARALIDAGSALAVSTDINPGSAPCPSMQFVMAIACRYQKLLPSEAFNAATINAAYAIGMGDKIGSLETGKQDDLLIVNATDYRQIAYQFGGNLIETVIKRGQIVSL
jgi:imidazolonepropionase